MIPKVIALVIEGLSNRAIADRLSTSARRVCFQTVAQFRKRHAPEIEALQGKARQACVDFAIAQQVNRIRDAQLRRDLLDNVRQVRAAGGTGMETGIVVRTFKIIGSGEGAEMVEEYKVDVAFLAEWRANERHVAEQLGQLPRDHDDGIPAPVQVLVRTYIGLQPDALT